EESAARLRALIEAHPDDSDLREDRALLSTGLGNLHLNTGHLERADREYRLALRDYEGLSAGVPCRRFALGRAGCEVNLGAALAPQGRRREALDVYTKGLKSWEGLARDYPRDAEVLHGLAGCLTDKGNLLCASRPTEAEALLRRSLTVEDALLALDPAP